MSGERILIIEDNRVLAIGLETFLATYGYQVLLASNGLDALDVCEEGLPDLVISDVIMQKMDGVTFLKNLRKMPGGGDLPVIVITGHADQRLLKKVRNFNIVECFPKPFDLRTLLNAVQTSLS